MAQEVNEHLTKKIEDRDWRRICLRWIDHVPDFTAPGIPPELPLAEMPDVSEAVAAAPRQNFSYITHGVDGVRQGMLHEGIYIFHKSAHIFGYSMLQVQHGMCTWSTSCAYQAAYFAAKAIVSLLGGCDRRAA